MSPGILSEAVTARDVPARFAVAFSLAGEQRQLVLAVAQEVEAVLGRSTVFYDAWYEHWIAGNDADLLLQHVYSDMSELVVFCVSGHYGGKPWTQTEHRAIRARMMQSDSVAERRILPVRVVDGEVDGVLFTDIVPDLRTKTPTEAAELIIARLNLVRGPADGIDHANVQWPTDPPILQWPIADHSEARRAFAMLLTALSPSRLLLVQGPSETGKTHRLTSSSEIRDPWDESNGSSISSSQTLNGERTS